MAIGKEIYELLRTHGGIAGDYQDIIESDFTAASGSAYSPPEESNFNFRRVVAARDIQILAECPVVIVTYQTSNGILRLPANTVSDSTNDSANGRVFIFDNNGSGNIEIKDYLGTHLFYVAPDTHSLVFNYGVNLWNELRSSGSILKSGSVLNTSFSGNPKIYDVVFASPFVDNNYSVTITGSESRSWFAENIVASGFRINSAANQLLTGKVHWHASYNG